MKPKDLAMANLLREDSRKSLTHMCRRLGLPISTGFKCLKRLTGKGMVRPVSMLDFEKLGFPVRTLVLLKTENKAEVINLLGSHHRVNNLFRVSGSHNYVAELLFRNLAEQEDFIEKLKMVKGLRAKVLNLLTEIKAEGFRLDCSEDKV